MRESRVGSVAHRKKKKKRTAVSISSAIARTAAECFRTPCNNLARKQASAGIEGGVGGRQNERNSIKAKMAEGDKKACFCKHASNRIILLAPPAGMNCT